MKKALSVLLVSLILCLAFCPVMFTVSAKEAPWELSADAEYITHGDKKYVYMKFDMHTGVLESEVKYLYDDAVCVEYKEIELTFADSDVRDDFRGSYIIIRSKALSNVAIQAELYYDSAYSESAIYVEQSYVDEYKDLSKGIADTYYTNNHWDEGAGVKISFAELESLKKSTQTTISGRDLSILEPYYLYALDSTGDFAAVVGAIYWDKYPYDEMTLQILLYDDYDKSNFYYGGEFVVDAREDYVVYTVEDEALKEEIISCYEEEPEDELDWMVADEASIPVATIFCTLVFGVFSLLLIGLSVTMLTVLRDKKYRHPFVIMLIGAIVVLIAYITILLILI